MLKKSIKTMKNDICLEKLSNVGDPTVHCTPRGGLMHPGSDPGMIRWRID
jgi:hypothetical protein